MTYTVLHSSFLRTTPSAGKFYSRMKNTHDDFQPSNKPRSFEPSEWSNEKLQGVLPDESKPVIQQSRLSSSPVELNEKMGEEGLDLESAAPSNSKPFSFYMSMICLCLIVLLVAWEAASLAAAIAVCPPPPSTIIAVLTKADYCQRVARRNFGVILG